jgi:hypothetical protein
MARPPRFANLQEVWARLFVGEKSGHAAFPALILLELILGDFA